MGMIRCLYKSVAVSPSCKLLKRCEQRGIRPSLRNKTQKNHILNNVWDSALVLRYEPNNLQGSNPKCFTPASTTPEVPRPNPAGFLFARTP